MTPLIYSPYSSKMNRRRLSSLLLLLAGASFSGFAADVSLRSYGPESANAIVFVAEETPNSSARDGLVEFEAYLASHEPTNRISIAFLPTDKTPSERKALLAFLESLDGTDITVVALAPGKKDTIRLHPGAGGKTCPKWLLASAAESLNESAIPWTFAEKRLPLYRLGWVRGDALLGRFLERDIPAILLETDADVSALFGLIAASVARSRVPINDRHYIIIGEGDSVNLIGEGILATAMVVASAVILFYLFFFSFLFGKKSDQRLRDLLRVWWLPFLYCGINLLALFGSQSLAGLLCRVRFGTERAWMLIPQLAFVAKLLIAWFAITLVVSLNQLIRFPKDSFIYGYIASVVCLLNFYLFSALDFSLAPVFLSLYAISFFAYHVDHPAAQAFSIVAILVPAAPYLHALFWSPDALGTLLGGGGIWNLRIALFAMPVQLMVSRLSHTMGTFGAREKAWLSPKLFVAFGAAMVAVSLVLFFPAWSPEKPLDVGIVQTVASDGNAIKTESLAHPERFIPVRIPTLAERPELAERADAIVEITSKTRKFLDRQLVDVTVRSAIPLNGVELDVTAENGISVYDASVDFTLSEGGKRAVFPISVSDGATSCSVSFSSDFDSSLSVSVNATTDFNPWGYAIPADFVKSSYTLNVREFHSVQRPADARSANGG